MDFSEYFLALKKLRGVEEIRYEIQEMVRNVDAARVHMEHKETAEYAVFIPEREKLLERIKRRSKYKILTITGYNGDGKSTVLKALSVLLKDEGAKYAFVTEELKEPARYFLDGIDEAIRVSEDGELYLEPKANNTLARIVDVSSRRVLERMPVIGATRTSILVLRDLRTDFQRRSEEVLSLERHRKESYSFVLMRDLAVYAIDHHADISEALEIRNMLSSEPRHIDDKRYTVSEVHALYEQAFSLAFESSKPVSELVDAPRKYNKDFEEVAVEVLREQANRLSRFLGNVEIEVVELGGVNEPDAEIVVYTPEGEAKIAFEAKFHKEPSLKGQAYTKNYPVVFYFVASTKPPEAKFLHRIPYTLGYVLAKTGSIATHAGFLDFSMKLLEALRYSKASKPIALETSEIVKKVLKALLEEKRDPKGKRFKSIKDSRLKKLGIDDPEMAIALVNSFCGEEIISTKKMKGGWRPVNVKREAVESCLKKLTGR